MGFKALGRGSEVEVSGFLGLEEPKTLKTIKHQRTVKNMSKPKNKLKLSTPRPQNISKNNKKHKTMTPCKTFSSSLQQIDPESYKTMQNKTKRTL